MKRLLGIVVLGLLICGNAYAFNFKEDIKTYSQKNEGVVSVIYVLNRCSGLLTYTAAMLLNESGKKNVAEKYMDHSLIIFHTAINLHSKHHSVSYDKAREILTKKRSKLINFYRDDAEKLFLRNGSYLSGYILEDIKECKGTAEFLKNS